MDSRHFKRIKLVQEIYSLFYSNKKAEDSTVNEIVVNKNFIDEKIQKVAPKYEISKIAKVDLAILRLAIYELLIKKTEPPKVVINEAIELAKELSSIKSPGFINAVLGKIFEDLNNEKIN